MILNKIVAASQAEGFASPRDMASNPGSPESDRMPAPISSDYTKAFESILRNAAATVPINDRMINTLFSPNASPEEFIQVLTSKTTDNVTLVECIGNSPYWDNFLTRLSRLPGNKLEILFNKDSDHFVTPFMTALLETNPVTPLRETLVGNLFAALIDRATPEAIARFTDRTESRHGVSVSGEFPEVFQNNAMIYLHALFDKGKLEGLVNELGDLHLLSVLVHMCLTPDTYSVREDAKSFLKEKGLYHKPNFQEMLRYEEVPSSGSDMSDDESGRSESGSKRARGDRPDSPFI